MAAPATFILYAWRGDTLVDSALARYDTSWHITSPWTGGAPTRTEQIAASVPEPETYAMLLAGLGLMGFIARRRTQY